MAVSMATIKLKMKMMHRNKRRGSSSNTAKSLWLGNICTWSSRTLKFRLHCGTSKGLLMTLSSYVSWQEMTFCLIYLVQLSERVHLMLSSLCIRIFFQVQVVISQTEKEGYLDQMSMSSSTSLQKLRRLSLNSMKKTRSSMKIEESKTNSVKKTSYTLT